MLPITSRRLLLARWPPYAPFYRTLPYTRSSSSKTDSTSEDELAAARQWLSSFDKTTLPRNLAQIRYDRSSGAGGQHVNTTDSKATATWPLKAINDRLPKILHKPLRECRYYAKTSDSIVMQSQSSRKRTENENECYVKLYEMIRDMAKDLIPGETSQEQQRKVVNLKKAENAARIRTKKLHSSKKQARRSIGRG